MARAPIFGAQVRSFDPGAAKKIKGVEQVVRIGRGVAVCAGSFEAARRGRAALKIDWDRGAQPDLDDVFVEKALLEPLEKNRRGRPQ